MDGRMSVRGVLLGLLLLCLTALPSVQPHAVHAQGSGPNAEGSALLFPAGARGARANIEWDPSAYGDGRLTRRTIIYAYANAGEALIVGSSAIGVESGDIVVYTPGVITGTIGSETVPALEQGINGWSCAAQRAATGTDMGRIRSRAQELAGPDSVPRGQVPGGFAPCFVLAPETGVYGIAFIGPAGVRTDIATRPTGKIEDTPANFDARQGRSTSSWAVAVRPRLDRATTLLGRTFAWYLAFFTGGNQRPIYAQVYPVTQDGYRYRIDMHGIDSNGWSMYGNGVGFLDTDGTPLYHDILAAPGGDTQSQAQLTHVQGDITVAPPSSPFFFAPPSDAALDALQIPREPILPEVTALVFAGASEGTKSIAGAGGRFTLAARSGGTYEIVISADGADFSPDNRHNKVLRGVRVSGSQEVTWDGYDNQGQAFPAGTYTAQIRTRAGEHHFPLLDVESSLEGGPTYTLLNAYGDCVGMFGCTTAFYDDRGYVSANGTLVGSENGPLCPVNNGRVPTPQWSDVHGFDSAGDARAFGMAHGGNVNRVCDPDGGFGDDKGLDLWTYVPSQPITATIEVIAPTAIALSMLTAHPDGNGMRVAWATGTELDTWGFRVARAPVNDLRRAAVVSPLIVSRGRGGMGASYEWIDPSGDMDSYYWLVEVDPNGGERHYGPVRAQGRAAGTGTQLFLPLLRAR